MSYKGKVFTVVSVMIAVIITAFVASYSHFGIHTIENDCFGGAYEVLNLTPLVCAGCITAITLGIGFSILIILDGKEMDKERESLAALEAKKATTKTLNNTAMRVNR